MNIAYFNQGDSRYPDQLQRSLAEDAPARISVLGNLDILKENKIAFFCSSKCPGDIIIKTYDLAKKWLDDGVTVIGGFHSPVEQECLTVLLRGKQPVIVCPARSIEGMRINEEYKKPLEEGRLLILSASEKKERRITSETSQTRNRFVAAIADKIIIAHAEPSGRTEHLLQQIFAWGKPVFTFSSKHNDNLLTTGAKPLFERSGV
jgi:predicted Rossmann fold nucleotide-binding protein DprA/Smf involved in DNA uptake